jgi:hypothetical protein
MPFQSCEHGLAIFNGGSIFFIHQSLVESVFGEQAIFNTARARKRKSRQPSRTGG